MGRRYVHPPLIQIQKSSLPLHGSLPWIHHTFHTSVCVYVKSSWPALYFSFSRRSDVCECVVLCCVRQWSKIATYVTWTTKLNTLIITLIDMPSWPNIAHFQHSHILGNDWITNQKRTKVQSFICPSVSFNHLLLLLARFKFIAVNVAWKRADWLWILKCNMIGKKSTMIFLSQSLTRYEITWTVAQFWPISMRVC